MKVLMILVLMNALARAESGLFPVDHSKIPQPIRTASLSVVRIVGVADTPTKVISQDQYALYLEKAPKIDFFLKLIATRIQQCADQKLKECKIFYESVGTGFFVNSGDDLWTARHVIEGLFRSIGSKNISTAHKYKQARATPLKLLIYNQNDQVIFDSTNAGSDSVSISALGDIEFYGESLNESKFSSKSPLKSAFDFARLHLSKKASAHYLKVSTALPEPKKDVYVLGFPVPTRERFGTSGVPDADGFHLCISIGKMLPATQTNYTSKLGDTKALTQMDAMIGSMLLTHDADAVPGQSGGPIVNSEGDVVAIFTNHATASSELSPEDEYSNKGGEGPHFQWISNVLSSFKPFGVFK